MLDRKTECLLVQGRQFRVVTASVAERHPPGHDDRDLMKRRAILRRRRLRLLHLGRRGSEVSGIGARQARVFLGRDRQRRDRKQEEDRRDLHPNTLPGSRVRRLTAHVSI